MDKQTLHTVQEILERNRIDEQSGHAPVKHMPLSYAKVLSESPIPCDSFMTGGIQDRPTQKRSRVPLDSGSREVRPKKNVDGDYKSRLESAKSWLHANSPDEKVKYIGTHEYDSDMIHLFYYTLEILAVKEAIRITERDGRGHPREFRILNKENCTGYFDCFFTADSANGQESLKRIKECSVKRWKDELCWLITSEQSLPLINDLLQDEENGDDIARMTSLPYPYCFTDEAATERVFKFILLREGVNVHASIDPLLYKGQLKEIHGISWPNLESLQSSLQASDDHMAESLTDRHNL